MFDILPIVLPILITDVINPVLLAAVIFSLGSRKPFLNSAFILFGWFVLYFAAGIAIALGLGAVIELLANPRPIDFYIEIFIGLLLLWLGLSITFKKKPKQKKPQYDDAEALNPLKAFWMGALINIIGLPFALPYFAVIDQILKANLEWIPSLTVLLIYNLLYILPFASLLLIRIIYREKSDAIFSKINSIMERIADVLIPFIMLGIGGLLIADAIFFFAKGSPLF
ncbi:MAG: GAP family protein [Melioribacteraceae bacterium]|nr:GAP family protein [Melioribacteraceae bacterium]